LLGDEEIGLVQPNSLSAGCSGKEQSVWQYDAVGVLLFAIVLFRKNLFEPMRLLFCAPFIRKCPLVTYHELFAATVTPDYTPFPGSLSFL
jgi:hypothetical protein